ncbi:MAG TPA: hypothetical protein VN648_14365 [Candidatus Methylomirabilis sp.]|nr:hypothetical protein [Candidatus Methylomirabilis sp.]
MTDAPSEILEWVRVYLEQDEDIIVPIKKMWNEWYATHMAPSLSEFTQIVLSDDRVEKMRGLDHIGHTEEMSTEEREEYERDMEARGFYSGPRVKLKSRQITKEHIARMLKKHNDRMEQALQEARAMIPEDATEADEGNLIDAIMLARKLRRDLRAAGLEPPEDEYSRRPSGLPTP